GRGELNVLTNHQLGKTLWGGASVHGSFTDNEQDHDDDGFKDMPDRRTGVGLFRLFRKGEDNWEGQWNLLVARDRRSAGQFTGSGGPIVADPPYRIEQDNQRVEAWGKTGYFGFAKPHQSLGVIYSGSYHQLNNQYGRKTHVGEQRSGYLNVLYHTRIVNDAHQLALGATGRVDDFTESLAGRDFSRNENTLGGFGEYTYHWEASEEGAAYRAFTVILALRADRHNLGGYQLSPRLNVKYNPSERTALRASIGRGWRSPNLLVDNLNWLPSSRTVRLGTDDNEDPATATNPGFLGLETAWNYGVNFTHDFAVNGKSLQFVFDALRTEFQNQIV
ncbi:MAG: TonB-dependent receptor, partial [Bacteroidota bacterium]